MNPDRWQQIARRYHAALSIEAKQRTALLMPDWKALPATVPVRIRCMAVGTQ